MGAASATPEEYQYTYKSIKQHHTMQQEHWRDIFCRAEVRKVQAYFVYSKLSKPMDRQKRSGEGRSCSVSFSMSSLAVASSSRMMGASLRKARSGNALALAARKGAAVFADVGVPLVRELFGKFVAVGKLCRREDLLIRRVLAAEADILQNGIVKQRDVLENDRIQAHKFFRVDL